MIGYILDTNIFNHIVEGKVDVSTLFHGPPLYATHIQLDEIKETTDKEKQSQLKKLFSELPQDSLPTASFVLDVSRLGQARLSSGELYEKLRGRLEKLGRRKRSNIKDALIAETAIKAGLVLVTHDRHLFKAATEFGCAACATWRTCSE